MPSADQFVAESAAALFAEWRTGEAFKQADAIAAPSGDDRLRPLLGGVDALIRQGLREQCDSWPEDWSTDGVSAYRCVRLTAREVEIVGLCWAFTSSQGAHATFPIRARFELNTSLSGLSWFRCEIGDTGASDDRFPTVAAGAMIFFDDPDRGAGASLSVGRRIEPIRWTPTIDLNFM